MRTIRLQPAKPGYAYAAFSYDPALIAIIKQIPGREWNRANRLWLIPATPANIDRIRALVPADVTVAVAPDLEAAIAARAGAIASAAAVKTAGDSSIDFAYVTPPYAHQRAGLEFLAKIGSGALLWEMGLGKTKTAIDYAEWLAQQGSRDMQARGYGNLGEAIRTLNLRVLVICPNTVKRNWGAEIEKHAGHTRYVIPTGTVAKRVKLFGTTRYTIVNCEVLSLPTAGAALRAIEWDLVIVDESTRFKTPQATRTKTLHKLKAKRRIILTGTPITGKAEDAWAQFQFVDPGMLGSWWSFMDTYLLRNQWTKAIEGVRPERVADLESRIGDRSYRIRKSEVLDLPPKVYEDRLVELTPEQRRLYDTMKKDLRMAIEGDVVEAFNILTQILRLTQITAGLAGERDRYSLLTPNPKWAAIDEIIDEVGPDEPIVFFGIYQKELEALAHRFGDGQTFGYRGREWPSIIYGPTPESLRHDMIARFQSGRSRRLFVQQHTGGIGINLTAAKYAVYVTRSWSLEDWLQSQDRLHRIGQTGTVTIITLTAKGTIDEQIAAALGEKQDVADALTGDRARALARSVLED